MLVSATRRMIFQRTKIPVEKKIQKLHKKYLLLDYKRYYFYATFLSLPVGFGHFPVFGEKFK